MGRKRVFHRDDLLYTQPRLPAELAGIEWDSGNASPWFFNAMSPGHRCAWTCRWRVGSGIVLPAAWFLHDAGKGLTAMGANREALYFELADALALGHQGALDFFEPGSSPRRAISVINPLLANRWLNEGPRKLYSEFIASWTVPNWTDKQKLKIVMPRYRPGWNRFNPAPEEKRQLRNELPGTVMESRMGPDKDDFGL